MYELKKNVFKEVVEFVVGITFYLLFKIINFKKGRQ